MCFYADMTWWRLSAADVSVCSSSITNSKKAVAGAGVILCADLPGRTNNTTIFCARALVATNWSL